VTHHPLSQRPFSIVETPLQHDTGFIRFRSFDTPLGKHICQQIFSGQTYPLLQIEGTVSTIVDIGANVGAATVYFALTYPAARVLAFEPDPACFELLRWNCQAFPNVAAFPYGLAEQDANVPLYLGEYDSVTNSIRPGAEVTTNYVPVDLRKASTVFAELGLETVDVLKVDTEGCEVEILKSLAPWLPRLGLVHLEFHCADDRLSIERMLTGSHLLCRGRIYNPHRGELCYVARERLPVQRKDVTDCKIA
jgi:FkbM family methyltransferase